MRFFKVTLSLSALAIVGLQGCSLSGEDPRVTFCRGLAAELAGVPADNWEENGYSATENQHAEVRVKYDGLSASCYYAYDAPDETGPVGQGLVDYASLPFRMTYNGVEIAETSLRAAVMVQQKEAPVQALQEAQKELEQVRENLQQAVQQASNR